MWCDPLFTECKNSPNAYDDVTKCLASTEVVAHDRNQGSQEGRWIALSFEKKKCFTLHGNVIICEFSCISLG